LDFGWLSREMDRVLLWDCLILARGGFVKRRQWCGGGVKRRTGRFARSANAHISAMKLREHGGTEWEIGYTRSRLLPLDGAAVFTGDGWIKRNDPAQNAERKPFPTLFQ
jgi:hypothetical protein